MWTLFSPVTLLLAFPVKLTDTDGFLPAELRATRPGHQHLDASRPDRRARTYHSIALLLPDSTVIASGGGLCGIACLQNHFNAQKHSPAHLFKEKGSRYAIRPVVKSLSATTVKPGATLTVMAKAPGTSVTGCRFTFLLVRAGSATHMVITDQRRIPLKGTESGGPWREEYAMTLPADAGSALPGLWMLFAMDAAGVPSVSRQVKIQNFK